MLRDLRRNLLPQNSYGLVTREQTHYFLKRVQGLILWRNLKLKCLGGWWQKGMGLSSCLLILPSHKMPKSLQGYACSSHDSDWCFFRGLNRSGNLLLALFHHKYRQKSHDKQFFIEERLRLLEVGEIFMDELELVYKMKK